MTARKSTKGGKGGKRYGGLPPKEPQKISLERAVDLTQRYRKSAPASEHGGFFWADGVRELLAQPNVVGLRYYHGLDADGHYEIVLVGVDSEGRDIVSASRPRPKPRVAKGAAEGAAKASAMVMAAGAGSAVILDMHYTCPPFCDTTSPLL